MDRTFCGGKCFFTNDVKTIIASAQFKYIRVLLQKLFLSYFYDKRMITYNPK